MITYCMSPPKADTVSSSLTSEPPGIRYNLILSGSVTASDSAISWRKARPVILGWYASLLFSPPTDHSVGPRGVERAPDHTRRQRAITMPSATTEGVVQA